MNHSTRLPWKSEKENGKRRSRRGDRVQTFQSIETNDENTQDLVIITNKVGSSTREENILRKEGYHINA
jgi:hypothetical protein